MSAEAYQGDVEAEPAGMPQQADPEHEPAGMPVQAADLPQDDAGPVNPASDTLDGAGASAPETAEKEPPGPPPTRPPMPHFTDPRDDPEYQKLRAEEAGLKRDAVANAKLAVDSLEQARRERAPPPRLQSIPKAPTMDLGQGAQGFLLAATALGALAGARGRSGATGALNAFSAAIQGYHNGQLEVWKQKSQEWKQQADQMISDNQEKLQQYKLIHDDQQMNIDQKMEEYKIVASTYGDQINWNLANQRNITMIGQNFQKDWMNTLKAEKAVADLDAANNKQLAQAEAREAVKNDIATVVEGIKDNTIPPDKIPARYAIPVEAELKRQGINLSDKRKDWTIVQLELKNLNSNAMLNFVRLLKQMKPELDRFVDLSKQLSQDSNFQFMNDTKLETYARANANNPKGVLAAEYLSLVPQVKELAAQIAKGGYAPTESAFKLADEMIKPGWSTKQVSAVAEQMETVLNFRMKNISHLNELGPDKPNQYLPSPGAAPAAANDDEIAAAKRRLGIE